MEYSSVNWQQHDQNAYTSAFSRAGSHATALCILLPKGRPAQDILSGQDELAHCGLMTPYGDTDLGQQWLR